MPKYSIIVPAYNVENEIETCLNSIFSQDYSDFEVIVVDDCSTDSTKNKLQLLNGRWPFKLIELPVNKGLANARNVGFKAISGEYVLFIDSDDYLNPGMLSHLSKYNAYDVLVFNHQRVWANGDVRVNIQTDLLKELSGNDIHKSDVIRKCKLFKNLNVAWNKCYRTAFLSKNDLYFEDGYYEDITFNYKSLALASNVQVTKYVGINYFQRNGSILNSKSDKHQDITMQYNRLFSYFENSEVVESKFKSSVYLLFIEHIFNLMVRQNYRLTDKAKNKIISDFDEIVKRYCFCHKLSGDVFIKKLYLQKCPVFLLGFMASLISILSKVKRKLF